MTLDFSFVNFGFRLWVVGVAPCFMSVGSFIKILEIAKEIEVKMYDFTIIRENSKVISVSLFHHSLFDKIV